MKTQNQLIHAYLKQGNTITQKRAARSPFYCTRLAARICDLRNSGVPVITDTIKYRSRRTGQPVAFARYSLGEEIND